MCLWSARRITSLGTTAATLATLSAAIMASAKAKSNSNSNSLTPKVFALDLDGCVWEPEMYELWGRGGAPFTPTGDGNLKDRAGNKVSLMGDVRNILTELATEDRWKDTKVAIASRCDEPSWAAECIKKFRLNQGLKLDDAIDGPREIHKGCKTIHLKNISKQTGVALEDMVFFDDQYGNCRDVASIGVTAVYTPDGLTRKAFDEALDKFPSKGKILGPKNSGPMFW